MYKIVLFCALRLCSVLCCTGVLFSVAPVLLCSLYYLLCAAYMFVVYVFCICVCVYLVSVLCVCMCVYVCMCVCILCALCALCVHLVCAYCVCMCVREVPVEVSTQSDTPHVGYLCGYMVRIIKYKKTQPLIKLKSI